VAELYRHAARSPPPVLLVLALVTTSAWPSCTGMPPDRRRWCCWRW
jgi:hypothetical protein